MDYSTITLGSGANQTINIAVTVDGGTKYYQLKLRYRGINKKWYATILDRYGGVIVRNVPLVLQKTFPTADLLKQFAYLNLGCMFVLPETDEHSTEDPGRYGFIGDNKQFTLNWGDNLGWY